MVWIFLGAPYVEVLRSHTAISAALATITAAVVGVILNLAVWFGLHVLFGEVTRVSGFGVSFDAPVPSSVDTAALVLTLGALVAVFRFKVGMLKVLAACSLAGLLHGLP